VVVVELVVVVVVVLVVVLSTGSGTDGATVLVGDESSDPEQAPMVKVAESARKRRRERCTGSVSQRVHVRDLTNDHDVSHE